MMCWREDSLLLCPPCRLLVLCLRVAYCCFVSCLFVKDRSLIACLWSSLDAVCSSVIRCVGTLSVALCLWESSVTLTQVSWLSCKAAGLLDAHILCAMPLYVLLVQHRIYTLVRRVFSISHCFDTSTCRTVVSCAPQT